jgi:diguanylate cyclase (GGDEF)-like protein
MPICETYSPIIDLDGFKAVNDDHGHDAGDTLLRLVAQRLLHCLREGDTVCRLAGDEFVCLLPNIKSAGNAERVARKVVAALEQPARLEGYQVTTHAGVGFSLYPDDGTDESTLLGRADAAMYVAKRETKNRSRHPTATSPASDR